jgi:tetratricopeptide (TPR) repeat protein
MRRVFGLWPYIVIGAAYLVVRGVVLSGLAASNYPRPLSWVGLTVPAALWFYLRQLLWPFGLSLFYDFDLARTFSLMGVAVPLLLSMLAIGLFIHAGRRRGLGLLAATWILTPLAPVLAGMKYFQWHDYVHDRYLYLPSVMTAILLAASLKNGAEWLAKKRGFESIGRVQAASIAIVAMVFAISTIRQSRQWESDLAVFSHAHERAPRNPVPVDYMARTLYGLGRADEAVAAYRGLLQTDPDYWQANYVLGLAYYQMGQIDEAKKYLKIATQVWPRDFIRPEPAQFYYLGMVQLRKSEYADAEISLRKAVELRPTAVGYRNALGTALQHLGHTEEAQQQFRLEAENRKAFDARQREFDTN